MKNVMESLASDKKRLALSVMLVVAGLLSFFVLAPFFSDPQTYAGIIASLDGKQAAVTEVMAGAMAASVGLSAIHLTQAIGQNLADLSGYFVIILSAVILEKYLLVILGKAAFMVLVPVACAMLLIHVVRPNEAIRTYASKILALALAMVLVIPVSVLAADFVSETYGDLTAITIEENVAENDEAAQEEEVDFWSDPLAGIQKAANSAGEALESAKAEAEGMMNRFVEQTAIFLITTCVLPILILLFFLWIVKAIFKVNVALPTRVPMEKNPLRKVSSSVADFSNSKREE